MAEQMLPGSADIISKSGIWSLGYIAIKMLTSTSDSSSWQIVIFSPLNCLSFKFSVIFINSEYFFMESWKFSMYKVMSPVSSSTMNSIPLYTSFVWLSCLKIPEVCWLKVDEMNIFNFFSFREQAFNFSLLRIQLLDYHEFLLFCWNVFLLLNLVTAFHYHGILNLIKVYAHSHKHIYVLKVNIWIFPSLL